MSRQPSIMADARQALQWMRNTSRSGRRLFRGQSKVYTTVKPSMAREDLPENVRIELWNLCVRFEYVARSGLSGYAIRDAHDRLAILQHYLLRSPVVDLTGTPEIALHFATLTAKPGQQCVIYALDLEAIEAQRKDAVITNHAFLALPFNEGGRAHRWLRQDGYSVGPKDWKNREVLEAFDLLRLPGLAECRFIFAPSDRALTAHLGDLESVEGDPLARSVRGIAHTVALSLGLGQAIFDVLNKTNTVDPHSELLDEIAAIVRLAEAAGDKEACEEGARIKAAASSKYWDASWDCSLTVWKQRVFAIANAKLAAEAQHPTDHRNTRIDD